MAKQLKMNLQFTADNKKVMQSIQEVQTALGKLTSGTLLNNSSLSINRDLQQAVNSATELQAILDSSMNANTGNLDLSKFTQQLKTSGKDLAYYRDQLYQLGPTGEQAFVKLTNAITLAEMPLKRTSSLLNSLWNTMKNTARWQLTSSALHGFIGAVQTAYGYSQDLNESLNNIRIVTGSSVEKMSEFAKEANKAAKELNTTTLDYTDAALIYYQQGLSESQVKERTDVTVKLANVARKSAEDVSDQMTAIWNNFYDGSQSLEHYANVLTALGAATASSTDEIAGGLEKFAGVANTIGLSYEYAASALATITSNTRESEEVVGTALKTIFARIQGLNLGETLDDGVTLDKYSEALQKVGINILDTQGNLKTMDTLLNEMGEKWDNLSNAQQTALAKTVAGTRQYNQLITLMANWDSGDGDSFQANLKTARGSSGALQEQADIYAESWEAARDRVRASAEEVYTSILDDEFFIELTDRFAELLDGVKLFIDSLGGIKGVLLAIGSIFTNIFSKQIGQTLSNAAYNIRMSLPGGKDAEKQAKEQANELLIGGAKDSGTLGSGYRAGAYEAIAKNQLTYIVNAKSMSETETKINQLLMDRNKLLQEEVVKQSEKLDQIKAVEAISRRDVQRQAITAGKSLKTGVHGNEKAAKNIGKHQAAYEKEVFAETAATALANKTIEISVTSGETIDVVRQHISGIVTELAGLDAVMEDDSAEATLQANYKKLAKTFSITEAEAKDLWNTLQSGEDIDDIANKFDKIAQAAGINAADKLNRLRDALRNCTGSTETADALLADYLASVRQLGPESVEAADKLARLNQMVDQHNKEMSEAAVKPIAFGEALSKATSAIMAMGQAYNTVKGIIDVFNDENAFTGDKIMSIVMGIGMLIPAVMALAPAFSTAKVSAKLFGAEATKAGIMANLAMWQVTLIVAAITAIVAVVAALVTKESAAEKKAREAAETAEQFKEEAEAAAQSLDKIKNAFDAYDTAVDKLNQCVKGTEEWKEALKEVNNVVLQLLADVPELAKEEGLFQRNLNTGMLELNEDKREEVLRKAENRAALTSAKSVIANGLASKASAELMKEEVKDDIDKKYKFKYTNADGDKVKEKINLREILTDNAAQLTDLTAEEYRNKIKEIVANEMSDSAKQSKEFNDILNDIADQAEQYKGSLQSLGTKTNEAANQIQTAIQLIADAQLGDKYGAAEKTMASAAVAERTKELKDLYYSLMTEGKGEYTASEAAKKLGYTGDTDIGKGSSSGNEVYQYIANKLDELGTGYSAAAGNTVIGVDGKRRFKFTDNATGDITDEKSADWVAKTIAAAEALQELGDEAEAAGKKLKEIDANIVNKVGGGQAAQTAVRGFIANKNFDGHTMSDFNTFYSEVAAITGNASGDISKEDAAWYVDKVFGDGKDGMVSEETAKKYGFESGQAMIDAFYDELSTMGESWQSIELPSDLLGTGKLQIETANKLNNIFKNINLGPAGEAASVTFKNGLNKMLEGLDEETQTKALGQLANIDWSSWDALEQADAIMKDLGVEIDTSSDYWKTFAAEMQRATRALPDFTQLKQTLIDISSITSELEFGSIIDDEEYQKLIDYNDEWERFFIMQADGSRKFIGDAKDMANATRDNIRAQQSDLKTRKDLADAINANESIDLSTISAMAIDDEFGDGNDGKLSDTNTNVTKAGYSGAGAGAAFVNNTLADRLQALLNDENSGASIKSALAIGGYDETTIATILAETRAGNHERQNAMVEYLKNYLGHDYNVDSADLNEMLASTAISMTELEGMRKEVGEDAYSKQKDVLENALAEAQLTEQYHQEDKILDSINNKMSKLAALRETMSSSEYLESLATENELLTQQANLQSSKISDLKTKIAATQKTLSAKYGAEFDDDGNILNYNDIMANNIGNWEAVQEELSQHENNVNLLNNTEQDLIDTQNQMRSNALAAYETMGEELAKYSSKMQHHNNLLEHQKNLLTLIGKETDYDALNAILEGQAKLADNSLKISKQTHQIYKDQADELKKKMDASVDIPDMFNNYKQQWELMTEKAREAEDQMLSDLSSWAESEKAILENTLADLGKSLEETLTGGKTFDELNTQMERAQSLQEEYLTTTNQIYETTKMMRTAQQAIDASSNTVAKEKLKNFITETKSLQEQGKLSQYELDMQQAKYDLLVAEIALEEAQNAKSTVRLQRDSEGNFGYVYTADANAVADAQQKFDDAENALYNKGLEGANNYAQKYQQTMSEMTSTLQEIQTNYLQGSYASEEEYQAAMTEARTYYTQQLQTYSDLYGIATEGNTNIINEAWSSSCDIMSTSVSEVGQAIDDYMENASTAFSKWQEVVATVEETTGKDLASIEANVNEVTSASDNLAKVILGENGEGGLISELKQGFTDVAKVIEDALATWSGVTLTVNEDGTISFAKPETEAATGGLTSAWGPEGKMLMVHESELILNKDETSQFFKHLNMMESILSTLDLYAASQQLGGVLTSPTGVSAAADTLEQNVKIEASFPGVTDRNEIEEAFNNLVNKASQYANRK